MIFFKFLKSRTFLINLILAILALGLMYYLLLLSLSKYTHHDEQIEVPNFLGLTHNDALETAAERKLRIQVSDTIYAEQNTRGLIAAQLPPASSKVKEGRTIYLTINSLHAELVNMPNLVGTSIRQAMADAEIYGIKIGELTYVPDIAKNNVLSQKVNGEEILPGTKIEKGTYIDLTLGLGMSAANVFIPVLMFNNTSQADSILQSKYLNVGALFYDQTVKNAEDSANAIVYQQNPKPLTKNIRPGDFVDLWLTTDTTKVIIEPEWIDSLNIKIDTLSYHE